MDWDCFDSQFAESFDENRERWRAIKAKRRAEGKCWQCAEPIEVCTCPNVQHERGWDDRYRRIDEGEIIQDGDEVLTDSHLGWRKAEHAIGQAAPNPFYTSHRMYRRIR